jgi:hypothetical protein
MSENTARQPKGVPVGGQFAATARGETGLTLGVPATPDPEALAAALTELADAIVRGSDVVLDSYELRDAIIPNVPSQVRDDLWHEVLVATVHNNDRTVETLTAKLGALEARETRWRNDPTFTSPTGEVTHQGTNGPVVYTTVQGSKYTGTRDVAAVAKDVRTDLKDAVTAGYLPDDVTFAVTCSKYAGGQAMQVDIRGLADTDIYQNDPTSQFGQRYSAEANELRSRVEGIAGAHTRDTTDVQTDYFHVMYYTHVSIENEQGAEFRAKEKARLAHNKAVRAGTAA